MTELFNQKHQTNLRKDLRRDSPRAERILWQYLRKKQLGCRFRRQYGIGRYVVDFYCPKLRIVIEVDGDSHFSQEVREYDQIRDSFMRRLGIEVLRFTNDEVYFALEDILERIASVVCVSIRFLPLRRGG